MIYLMTKVGPDPFWFAFVQAIALNLLSWAHNFKNMHLWFSCIKTLNYKLW